MTFSLLKVGSDTEFFLSDRKTGLPVTAIGRFGGTKQNPRPVLDEKGFCIQEDNVMAEVNIPACSNTESFYKSRTKILNWLKEEAKNQGLMVQIAPSMKFSLEQLNHPQAKHIGCEPDYCVWTRKPNEFDETKREMLEYLRTAGGHVHISFNHSQKEITTQDRELLVMFCDLLLGVPSIILDKDMERRKLYGKAGSFRFKDYGIEYRVLSNFWFASEREADWVFRQVQYAIGYMNSKNHIRILYDLAEDIQTTINTQNERMAYEIREQWNMRLP